MDKDKLHQPPLPHKKKRNKANNENSPPVKYSNTEKVNPSYEKIIPDMKRFLIQDTRQITVYYDEMDICSRAAYQSIREQLEIAYPPPLYLITCDEFVRFIRAVFKSRIDHVSENITKTNSEYPLKLEFNYSIPKLLADIINSFGCFDCHYNSTTIYPIMQDILNYDDYPVIDPIIEQGFQSFIKLATNKNLITTDHIHSDINGTSFWCLRTCHDISQSRVTEIKDLPVLANESTNDVFIMSQICDFNSTDALFASLLCQQHRDCVIISGSADFPFYASIGVHIPQLRHELALT